MLEIIQIPVLSDNYIYLLHEPVSGKTAVVDPAEAEPVIEELQKKGWLLDYITIPTIMPIMSAAINS